MTIEPTSYRDWTEAYRCTVGSLELIAVTSMGPRILSLRFSGGENLLYEDPTHFGVGAWRLYGGHRFTVAPESAASYAPDNVPCEVDTREDRLRICAPTAEGLLRAFEIIPCPCGAGFALRHRLRNAGSTPWHGAPWAITCVPATGKLVVPEPGTPPRFWSPPGENYADAASPQWRSADGCFVVEPEARKGKVGLTSERGWLALLRPDTTFVVQGPRRIPHATYPDGGCNVEIYTCADYLELETLGPLAVLLPGREVAHEQHWHVLPRAFTPAAWRAIHSSIHPALPHPDRLVQA